MNISRVFRIASFVVLSLISIAPGELQAAPDSWSTGGPEGGPVIALAVDPQTPGVVYAGAQFGGVFKTATAGSFWTPIDTGLTSLQVHALAIDPNATAIVYAGTAIGGVFKSTTGGVSWTAKNSGLSPNEFIHVIALDPITSSTAYAGTANGAVFKSTNGGDLWSVTGLNLPVPPFDAPTVRSILAVAIDPVTPSTLYAGTQGLGAFKSTNAGASWAPINTGLTTLNIEALVIDPSTPATIYAGTFGGGVFKSVSGGGNWSPSNGGLGDLFIQRLVNDPKTPQTLYAGTRASGVFKSTNGGASWSPASNGLPAASLVSSLAVDPVTPTTLYAGVYGVGVFRSTNGGSSWTPSSASLTASFILALSVDTQNPANLYAGIFQGGLVKSNNGGAIWSRSDNGIVDPTVNAVVVNPQSPSTLYAGTSKSSVFLNLFGPDPGSGGIFKSTDGGASWTRVLTTNKAVQALAIDPNTPLNVYSATLGQGIFKSTDGGGIWNQMIVGLDDLTVYALAIDPSTPATVYAGTNSGVVFKTTNGGVSWEPTGLSSAKAVVALAINPQAPSTVYASTSGDGVFRTTSGGASWVPVNAGLFNQAGSKPAIFSLAIDPQTPATVYAGSFDNGVFMSTNSGGSWNLHNPGLPPDAAVLALATNPSGTCVHAGTGGGVYDFASGSDPQCPPPPPLTAGISPTSLLVQVNEEARTFAVVRNGAPPAPGSSAPRATGVLFPIPGMTCGITQLSGAPTPFTFRAVNLTTNQPIAPPNTPVTIEPGTNQGFLISLTPTAPICALEVKFGYNCANAELAPIVVGVNTLLLTATGSGQCPGVRTVAIMNQVTFNAGDTLNLTIGGSNPGGAAVADVYIGAFLPDGITAIYLKGTGGFGIGSQTNLATLQPYRTGLQLPPSFSINIPNFLSYPWTGGEPKGDYVLFLLVMKAGAVPALTGDLVLGRATTPFSFR